MRKIVAYFSVLASMALLSSCAAAWQSVSYSDDLYNIHNKTAIAERQKAEAELAKAQYEAQQAQYEANLARIKAEAAKQNITVAEGSANFNAYDAVLADSYESAYARRLYGFSSPTYRMPSSYYTLRYSDAFFYASAYDPAFYNVMVSGDMVWVEPKYVTSMFGSWGATVVPAYNWYYGWVSPYDYWYRPYRYWHTPYCYGWNPHYYCGYYNHHYHRHHYHHHNNHYRPHRPSHRPPYAGSGSVGNTGHHTNRPGMVVGRNPGAQRPADRGGSSYRPSKPSNRGSQPAYRSGSSSSSSSSSSSRGNGSSSYRSGSTSSGSSSYRSGSSSSSFSSGSSSGSRSYSSGGGSSSGGNSRGR